MESEKEIRYYLANKKSWNDVTVAVTYKGLPKEGQIINVGKIKMNVKSVIDGTSNGRSVIKVFLENESSSTPLDEAIEMLDNPTFITINDDIEAIKEAKGKSAIKVGGSLDDRTYVSARQFSDTADAIRAFGPGSFGTLGGYVRSALSGLGVGYGVQVTDFGEAVTVTITYSNARTGRISGQSFVIVMHHGSSHKYLYTVYAHSARWRDCDDYNQAIGFIRSKASALAGQTSGGV